MDSEFRELTSRERGLLEKLLNAAIHGGDELRTQLNHVKAKQIEEDGTLRLQCDGGIPAPGKYAPVAEGICKDADGSDIAVMHLGKGGFMSMLEIIKDDGSRIITPPSGENLVLLIVRHTDIVSLFRAPEIRCKLLESERRIEHCGDATRAPTQCRSG